jgi:hypothetical protein
LIQVLCSYVILLSDFASEGGLLIKQYLKFIFFSFIATVTCHAAGLSFPVATIKSFDKPVEVFLKKYKIKVAPHSIITLDINESNDELYCGDFLTGEGMISASPDDTVPRFRAGGTTLKPGENSDFILISPSFTSLYPSEPAFINPDDDDGCIIFQEKSGEGKVSGKDGLLLYKGTILKADEALFANLQNLSSAKSACVASFQSDPPDSLSVSTANITYKIRRSYRLTCPFRSNRVLEKYSLPFRAEGISVSLDREDIFHRTLSFSFPFGANETSASVSNTIDTGPRAAIKFVLNSGYTVFVGPDSSVTVNGVPSTSPIFVEAKKPPYTVTELFLNKGSLLLLPPSVPVNRLGTDDILLTGRSPVNIKGKILFSSQVGASLFVSVREHGNLSLPVLLSLAGGQKARNAASSEVGRQELSWLQYVKEPSAFDTSQDCNKVLRALKQLAAAREKTVPLFSLIPALPSSRFNLFENFAMNIDGSSLEDKVHVLVDGNPESRYLKPSDLDGFIPRDDHNIVEISDEADKSPLMDIHFFNPLLSREGHQKKGEEFTLFAYFSKNSKASKNSKVLKPSELTKYKAAYDFAETQYEQHPYKVICLVIFLVALSVYGLATVPFKLASAIWYLFGYIRGEPCPVCTMPFEKEELPPLPVDAHLAITSRLAYYGVRIELGEIEAKVMEALDLAADIDPEAVKLSPVHVEGDCVWCLRCSKGSIRFRIMRHGEVAESGIHPLDHPGMLEFVRRWNGKRQ